MTTYGIGQEVDWAVACEVDAQAIERVKPMGGVVLRVLHAVTSRTTLASCLLATATLRDLAAFARLTDAQTATALRWLFAAGVICLRDDGSGVLVVGIPPVGCVWSECPCDEGVVPMDAPGVAVVAQDGLW